MINIRRAKPEDIDKIIDLVNQVFRTSNNYPPSMHKQFPLLLSKDNCRNLYIAEDDGNIISHNGIIKNNVVIRGHSLSMASMGSVCTHPDYRGQGIATKILKKIINNLNQEHVSLLTISGGRGLYLRQGAQTTAGKFTYLLNNQEHIKLTQKLTDLPLKCEYQENKIPDKVNLMSDLYQKQPVRYQRSRYEFPILLGAMPTAHDVPYPPDYLTMTVSYRKGPMLAYLIGYKTRDNNLSVVEYAGESMAVFYLIAKLNNEIIKEKEINKISLQIPIYQQSLLYLLNKFGLSGSSSYYNSTYKVINKNTLWQEIKPILQERISQKINLTLDNLPVDIDDKEQLLHLFFDKYHRTSYGVPWDDILPIPLPFPHGLNYI